jgi:hypothetical protein
MAFSYKKRMRFSFRRKTAIVVFIQHYFFSFGHFRTAVGNAAGGFARRLAESAFAAAAVFHALARSRVSIVRFFSFTYSPRSIFAQQIIISAPLSTKAEGWFHLLFYTGPEKSGSAFRRAQKKWIATFTMFISITARSDFVKGK